MYIGVYGKHLNSNRNNIPVSVVCLVLRDQTGAFLATQRMEGKRLELLWEFPGGKVEDREEPEVALRREIREELGIELGMLLPLPEVQYDYEFGSIRLLPFYSICAQRPSLTLTVHKDARWIVLDEWQSLSWAPADIPVIQSFLRMNR